jgi:hypothetical protein
MGAMKRLVFLAAGGLLIVAVAFAQEGKRTSDPVTGTWGANGMPFLELKYDGTTTVTGTAIWRHDQDEQRTAIEAGTFDRQTGALTLSGSAKNRSGQTVRYVIEGKVQGDTVSGTYRVGEEKGEFTFTRQ